MKTSNHQIHPNDKTVTPRVSVIIPHLRGYSILQRSVASLSRLTYEPIEIMIVDNYGEDGSIERVRKEFPEVQVVSAGKNLGFAGACNLGLQKAAGTYALLFNNDAEATPDFLGPLVNMMESDSTIAACQPKILSLNFPEKFDYAGAAGGFMDIFGFPFCRGRIFDTLEQDQGQYDSPREIFWASGACCLLRISAVRDVGLLDEDFFAHMEEIDLCWRLHLADFRVFSVPRSIVRHQAGSTLNPEVPFKVYLNHRNSLVMLLKNYSSLSLFKILPIRLALDFTAFLYRLLHFDFIRSFMILRASGYVLTHLRSVYHRRSSSQKFRRVSDAHVFQLLYRRSIVWDYFVVGRKAYSQLPISISR